VVGGLRSTGLRPCFVDKFDRRGIDMPEVAATNGNGTLPDFPVHNLP
jgi:hypothetical protein